MPDKPPEEWEAKDHIENLKRGLGNKSGVCEFHDDTIRSQIWLIRHTDLAEKNGNKEFKLGPITLKGFEARDIIRILIFLALLWMVLERHNLL